MALQMNRTDAHAEVSGLIDDWASAVRAKDLDAIFAHYAPDILAFDAIAQLQFKGTKAYRTHWQACMAMCPGQMIFEVHDLTVSAGDDVAFCHYLSRCGGAGAEGEEKVGWMRASAGLRRRGGKWLIVHEHFSAPFDPSSGKALFDLEP
jgi:ketosteroid isomerase-like protein